jgi:hypothetical protein
LVVSCNPNLPDNIIIDENNNLIIEIIYNLTNDKLINKEDLVFYISDLEYIVPFNNIKLKHYQTIIIENKGIPLINQDDVYCNKNKGDIIVNLTLQI